MTQRSTPDTNTWLRNEHASGSSIWYQQCLNLAHTARNIPAMYPSAFSAQHATPGKYQVHKLANVKRGMVAFFDNPTDSNPFGHIVTVQGRNSAGDLYCWSNDVAGRGLVSLVPMSFFRIHWGSPFVFAATWLNGVELDMPDARVKKVARTPHIDDAILSLSQAIDGNKGKPRIVDALKRDRRRLVELKKTM